MMHRASGPSGGRPSTPPRPPGTPSSARRAWTSRSLLGGGDARGIGQPGEKLVGQRPDRLGRGTAGLVGGDWLPLGDGLLVVGRVGDAGLEDGQTVLLAEELVVQLVDRQSRV